MRPLTEARSGLSTGALGIWIFMEWVDVILLKPVVGVPELKRNHLSCRVKLVELTRIGMGQLADINMVLMRCRVIALGYLVCAVMQNRDLVLLNP